MVSINEFENLLLDKLKNSNYVDHILMSSVLDNMSVELLNKLVSTPYKFSFSESGISFIDDDGDVTECPNFSTNISEDGRWLSEKLPDVGFDVEQGGNLRKSQEAEAAYCCCCVVVVLQDEVFKNELITVIKNYDYQTMDGIEKGENFKNLLTDWQDLQSTTINVCVSAAKFKISNLKKDTEKFLRDGIPEDLVIELRNLDSKIKDINRSFSTGVLSPLNVKKLTKIEILKHLDTKSIQIEKVVNSSTVATLYRILNLSTEYISPSSKNRLCILAQDEIDRLYDEDSNLQVSVGEKKQVIDRWKRRYLRLEKISIRKREVNKYLSDKEAYKLPPKL